MAFRQGDYADEEFEEDDAFDVGEELEEATTACPYCNEEIYEDSDWCPYCGNFISREDTRRPMRPMWIVAGVILCLVMVVMWTFLG